MPSYGNKYLGAAGQTTYEGTYSINLTLASDEYPTKVVLTNSGGTIINRMQADNGYICYVYICRTNGNNKHNICQHTFYDNGSGWGPSGTISGSFTDLQGAALAVGFTGPGGSCDMWNACTLTITTTYRTYAVTITNSTGGTVTASATSGIRAGATITLYRTASTGYQFSSWGASVTVNSSNQFSMPAANVTVSPTWTKISYTITKAVSPSGAGTLTAPATATYGATVTLSQTPASTQYTFSYYSVSSIGTLSGNSFTMPAQNVTVTAHYTQVSHTITWTNANLQFEQHGRYLTFTMSGSATSNFGERIYYEIMKDDQSIGQVVNNTLLHRLNNSDCNVAHVYKLVAIGDGISKLGYETDPYTATFPLPTDEDCGRYVEDESENGFFQQVILSYWTGSEWKECEIKYRDNGTWQLVKTFS